MTIRALVDQRWDRDDHIAHSRPHPVGPTSLSAEPFPFLNWSPF